MKILIDMNLTPDWIPTLQKYGWECRHWSEIGDPRATDQVIMEWARTNGYVVLTHDLDFGAMLAATRADGPSVIQIRAQDVVPTRMETVLVKALQQFEMMLDTGAIVVVNQARARVTALPLIR